jgi:hypothetical protein
MNISLSLFVYNFCLTFLTIACISINSNHKCTPWSASIIEPYYCGFTRAFIYPTWCPSSTHESSMLIQYPRECRSFLHHVIMMSYVPLCWSIYPRGGHLWSCWGSLQFGSSHTNGRCSLSDGTWESFFLHLEHLMKLSDKGDWVINATRSDSTRCPLAHK